MIIGILVGFLSGIISGMGIGGGAILIPALTLIMGLGQKEAQFVNLVYFIPTAIAALYKHRKNGNIEKGIIRPLIVYGAVGCVAGALFAANAQERILRTMFGVFLGFMGVYEIVKGMKKRNKN